MCPNPVAPRRARPNELQNAVRAYLALPGRHDQNAKVLTTTTSASLKDDELSAIYVSSDAVAGRGQKRTKLSVKIELIGLIVASVGGKARTHRKSARTWLTVTITGSGLGFVAITPRPPAS